MILSLFLLNPEVLMGIALNKRRQASLFDLSLQHDRIWSTMSPEQQQQALARLSALLVDIIHRSTPQTPSENDYARSNHS
jgi:hypothetical protein